MEKEKLSDFRLQSVWAVIGLSIITLCVYIPFWLRRQTKVINRLLPNNEISSWYFPVCMLLTVLNFGMFIPEKIFGDHSSVIVMSKIIGNIYMLITLIWVIIIRNRLNIITAAEKKTKEWFSIIWTIIFQALYLQYKINTLKEKTDISAEG